TPTGSSTGSSTGSNTGGNTGSGPAAGPTGPGASPAPTRAAPAGPAAPAVPASAPPFTFTFGGDRVGKLRVAAPIDVSTAYQLASVYDDGLVTNDKAADPNQPPPNPPPPTLYAYLTVYRPGAYDAKKLVNAK